MKKTNKISPSSMEIKDAVALLKQLIATPSFSKEENNTAQIIADFFADKGVFFERKGNNVWAKNKYFDSTKPTILLNSHHDTVKPNVGYTLNPFEPIEKDDKLFGLGSNDAGGALVSLLFTFLYFYDKKTAFNLIFSATAEEEISGRNGIESIVSDLGKIDFAIVGEPTLMNLAIAERGLLVIDCTAKGKAGHAARNEGVNAIYEAMRDIEWFRAFRFPKKSEWLGEVSMNVTVINAGQAHNQVPAECTFVVDIRLNECYTHEEVLAIIRANVKSEVKERSTRIKSKGVSLGHPIVKAAQVLGFELYGSPTTSDQALMPWASVKLGPGDSARSHSADEFIFAEEIEKGIEQYIELLNEFESYY